MVSSEATVLASHEFGELEKCVAGLIYMLTGVCGILVYIHGMQALNRSMPAPRYILYFHLYLANLTMCICSLFASMAAFAGGWRFGDQACQVYAHISFISGMASIFFTALLAAEAYLSVNWQQTYESLSSGPYHCVVVLVWIMAAMWAMAPLIGFSSYSLEPAGITCEISWTRTDRNHTWFLMLLMSAGFWLPFSLAVYLLFLSWCGPALTGTRAETNTGEKPWMCIAWCEPSLDHRAAILKASTLHLAASMMSWSPYALVCLLPYVYPGLTLHPLAIVTPSIAAKVGIALQGMILPFCSARVRYQKSRLD